MFFLWTGLLSFVTFVLFPWTLLWFCIRNNSTSLFIYWFNLCLILMPKSIFWLPTTSFGWCLLFSFLLLLQRIVLFSTISHMSSFILSLNSLLICYNCLEHLMYIINWQRRIDILYVMLLTVCIDSFFPLFCGNWQGWWFDMVFHLALTEINAQLQPERRNVLGGDWQMDAAQGLFFIGSDMQVMYCFCCPNVFFYYFYFIY